MSSLPYQYKLTIRWTGETHVEHTTWPTTPPPVPTLTEGEIDDVYRVEMTKAFLEKYVEKGWQIHVVSVDTSLDEIKTIITPIDQNTELYHFIYHCTSRIEFYTDHNADVGSPLDPATVAVIVAILTLVGIALKVGLLFYIVNIVDRNIEDMKTGLDDFFGKGAGGVGLFIIILALLLFGILFFIGGRIGKK